MPLFGYSDEQKRIAEKANKFQSEQPEYAQNAPEEAEAVEGDITDYVAPVAGFGRNLLKNGIKMAAKEGAEAVAKSEGRSLVRKMAGRMPGKPSTQQNSNGVETGFAKPSYDIVSKPGSLTYNKR